ncbi:MAG TPA: glycoside hydrolase domain-containing protein [Tepidisphaeraceae bacterium]|nr:glycoside hydrolase domain-containing protein [Tepidisphaeraceae bacterium]
MQPVAGGQPALAAQGNAPFQVGIEPPTTKIRRDVPYSGPACREASLELARNEYEGFQVIVSGVEHDLKNLRVTAGDLRSAAGSGVLAAKNVAIHFVGFVHTKPVEKYIAPWTGLWPDPLLGLQSVDLPAGKVQPIWVTLYAPAGTPAGIYAGELTIIADGIPPQAVVVRARVFDFDLPRRGAFAAMAIDGGPHEGFYGLSDGPELDSLRQEWDEFLCNHRLPPGGYALRCWQGNKPCYPAKPGPNGAWDFSAVEKRGQFLFDHGMNTFVMATFDKPKQPISVEDYWKGRRDEFGKFMTAYADFLRSKGWLKDAVVYNIDEAPKRTWAICQENYRQTKAISPDISVFQCLNEPQGVAALHGFFDVIDVNIGQFNQGAAPRHLAQGGRTWWCVCCWPSGHPNLFVEYPAIDARMIGWLSWKVGAQGFEYWDVSSWHNCLKTMGGKKFIDEVESPWSANSFGDYNGDGYLLYPGPNRTLLSSIRLEALRDGFEDYEYLAILRARAAQKTGPAAEEARRLLNLPDSLCRKDLTLTDRPKELFDYRHRVAEAIEKLGSAGEHKSMGAP